MILQLQLQYIYIYTVIADPKYKHMNVVNRTNIRLSECQITYNIWTD